MQHHFPYSGKSLKRTLLCRRGSLYRVKDDCHFYPYCLCVSHQEQLSNLSNRIQSPLDSLQGFLLLRMLKCVYAENLTWVRESLLGYLMKHTESTVNVPTAKTVERYHRPQKWTLSFTISRTFQLDIFYI